MSRFEAISADAFVQHVAIRLIGNGYCFFVSGIIPMHKNPVLVDQKFIGMYRVDVSKWTFFRAAERGEAKVRYVRHGRFFVLLATEATGTETHPFFEQEAAVLRDARLTALECFGYSIRCSQDFTGRFHPSVQLSFQRLASFHLSVMNDAFLDPSVILAHLHGQNFLWFANVKRQVFRILNAVNELRKKAGLELVELPAQCVINRSLQVFAWEDLDSK